MATSSELKTTKSVRMGFASEQRAWSLQVSAGCSRVAVYSEVEISVSFKRGVELRKGRVQKRRYAGVALSWGHAIFPCRLESSLRAVFKSHYAGTGSKSIRARTSFPLAALKGSRPLYRRNFSSAKPPTSRYLRDDSPRPMRQL